MSRNLVKALSILLVVGCVSGAVLWVRYQRKHTPSVTSWSSPEKPKPNELAAGPKPSIAQYEFGTIKGRVLDAKAEGLDQVEIGSLLCGWDIGNLREVLRRDTLMVAQVIDKKTFANQYDLITWYKFRVVESLSEKPMPNYANYQSLESPPEEIKPSGSDEFVIAEINGQMVIDGVKVTQTSNGVAYVVGNTYLLCLHLDRSKGVAVRSGTDPLGVFLVEKDGTFKPYLNEPYPLREQMAKRFGNSIENLRKALKT